MPLYKTTACKHDILDEGKHTQETCWLVQTNFTFNTSDSSYLWFSSFQAMNAFATNFFLRQIARRRTIIEKCQVATPSVTIHCKETGIDLLAWLEIECQTSVFRHTIAVPKPQVGFEEDIRQFMMEWCQERYAITGSTTAAGGVITSL